jgi:hypothetical protein
MDAQWTTKLIDKYIVVNKKLGQGSFGVVYHALMKDDFGYHLAAKTIQSKVCSQIYESLSKITNVSLNVSPERSKSYRACNTPTSCVSMTCLGPTTTYTYS